MDLPLIRKLLLLCVLIGGAIMPYENIFTSGETLEVMWSDKKYWIEYWAEERNIDPNLIRAIIKSESGDKSRAFRVDYKVLKNQTWYKNTLSDSEKNQKICYASYGLMQVLYGIAKHDGYKGLPEGLFNMNMNIKYGTLILRNNLIRYKGDVKKSLAAYNGGHGAILRKRKTGRYPSRVEKYVKEVYGCYQELSK
jgi:soluble lytic murein transglycosylase-like protein